MGVPYEIDPIPGVLITAGDDHVWLEVPFPTRVFVSKMMVIRTDGSASFSVGLYNSKRPMEAEDPDDPVSLPDGVPEDSYRFGPVFPSTGNKVEYFSDFATGGHGLSFYNKDAPPASRIQGVGDRKLYLRIGLAAPVGSDQKYCVSLGCEAQID